MQTHYSYWKHLFFKNNFLIFHLAYLFPWIFQNKWRNLRFLVNLKCYDSGILEGKIAFFFLDLCWEDQETGTVYSEEFSLTTIYETTTILRGQSLPHCLTKSCLKNGTESPPAPACIQSHVPCPGAKVPGGWGRGCWHESLARWVFPELPHPSYCWLEKHAKPEA